MMSVAASSTEPSDVIHEVLSCGDRNTASNG
jgi:hypothetical protein